ncbi:MAG: 5'/3'-nucleotidase SurE [Parabacteroides sp.]
MTIKKKPLILITNDDGINAKGIEELTISLKGLGEIIVFAPDGPRSGSSCAITSMEPIRCKLVDKKENLTLYKCTGTPADCIKLAINEILENRPDLVVAGINHGGNMSISVQYSGTMGAAAEGCVLGIPSVGISLMDCDENADFNESGRLGRELVQWILKEGLPHGTYLNLNIPVGKKIKGIKVCRQADGRWTNEYKVSKDAHDETVYWLSGNFKNNQPIHPDNDTLALDNGYASLVPCKIDVTDYVFLETLKQMI